MHRPPTDATTRRATCRGCTCAGGSRRRVMTSAQNWKNLSDVSRIARHVERVRHQRAVARPHVRVGVAREVHDVRVVGRDDAAALVDLRAHDEQRALVQIDDRRRQPEELGRLLAHPQLPVGARALDERLGPARDDLGVELLGAVPRAFPHLGRAQPVVHGARRRPPGTTRARRDHVSTAPCAIGFMPRLPSSSASRQVPSRPGRPSARWRNDSTPVSPVDAHVGEKVAPALVVRDGARRRIVGGGVADVGSR